MRGQDDIDPYEVLGLSPKADDVVVRAAWKALIRKYHPDTSAEPDAADRAARINAAFKLLITAEARAAYDHLRTQPSPAPPPPVRPAPPGWQAAARPWRPMPRPVPRRHPRLGKLVLAVLLVGLIGMPALYAAHRSGMLPMTEPLARMSAPWRSEITYRTRLLMGLDTPAPSAESVPAGEASPPVDRAVVTAAVDRFNRLSAEGRTATIDAARNCYAQAGSSPSWTALDSCAAFDIAGLAVAKGLFEEPDPNGAYFEQAVLVMPERYGRLSADDTLITDRLKAIRAIVWPILLNKFESRILATAPPSGDAAPTVPVSSATR